MSGIKLGCQHVSHDLPFCRLRLEPLPHDSGHSFLRSQGREPLAIPNGEHGRVGSGKPGVRDRVEISEMPPYVYQTPAQGVRNVVEPNVPPAHGLGSFDDGIDDSGL